MYYFMGGRWGEASQDLAHRPGGTHRREEKDENANTRPQAERVESRELREDGLYLDGGRRRRHDYRG